MKFQGKETEMEKLFVSLGFIILGLSLIYGMGWLMYTYDGWRYHPMWYAIPNLLISMMLWIIGILLTIGGAVNLFAPSKR